MRRKSKRDLRADLRTVRQDILLKIEEVEERTSSDLEHVPEEKTAPALLETIGRQMLEELGGGEFRIMLKGEQTLAQRVAELAEEKSRQLHLRW